MNFGLDIHLLWNSRIFGRKCYIKREDGIGKFYPRSDKGVFLRYSLKSKHVDVSIKGWEQ